MRSVMEKTVLLCSVFSFLLFATGLFLFLSIVEFRPMGHCALGRAKSWSQCRYRRVLPLCTRSRCEPYDEDCCTATFVSEAKSGSVLATGRSFSTALALSDRDDDRGYKWLTEAYLPCHDDPNPGFMPSPGLVLVSLLSAMLSIGMLVHFAAFVITVFERVKEMGASMGGVDVAVNNVKIRLYVLIGAMVTVACLSIVVSVFGVVLASSIDLNDPNGILEANDGKFCYARPHPVMPGDRSITFDVSPYGAVNEKMRFEHPVESPEVAKAVAKWLEGGIFPCPWDVRVAYRPPPRAINMLVLAHFAVIVLFSGVCVVCLKSMDPAKKRDRNAPERSSNCPFHTE
jgi:hypothetical protein